jgi:hypothetical protein
MYFNTELDLLHRNYQSSRSDKTQWEDSTTVASLPFVQNTFNYIPVVAEAHIPNKLNISSKSATANTTAR